MVSLIWTSVYVFVLYWLITRLLPLIAQWFLRRFAGVSVKIGKFGLMNCKKVQIWVKKGLRLEIEKVGLSSCFFNKDHRKPLVIYVTDLRIQADVRKESHSAPPTPRTAEPGQPPPHSGGQHGSKKLTLPKIAYYLQYTGLTVQNLTVMLLNTMIPDCLVHIEGQSLSLDISFVNDCYQVATDISGLSCKVLRSTTTDQGQNVEPCLAEMSGSLFFLSHARKDNLKMLETMRILLKKPQAILNEALFTAIQDLKKYSSMSQLHLEDIDNNFTETESLTALDYIPQEVGIDISELCVKITRQVKQRTLSVELKTFHLDFQNNTNISPEEQSFCNILVEDFKTESPQAKFSELLQSKIKLMSNAASLDVKTMFDGAFFNYHHEEVQYWSSILSKMTSKPVVQPPPSGGSSVSPMRNKVKDFCQQRNILFAVESRDLSTSLSSASSAGFHFLVQNLVFRSQFRPFVQGLEDSFSNMTMQDIGCQLDVQNVCCQQNEARVPANQLHYKHHYWGHAFYLGQLKFKGTRHVETVTIEGNIDHLHGEWSPSCVTSALYFIGAFGLLNRQSSHNMNEKKSELNIPMNRQSVQYCFEMKIEVFNINFFLCNNNKVFLMLRVDAVSMKYMKEISGIRFEGCKVIYAHQQKQYLVLHSSTQLTKPAVHVQEIRMQFKKSSQELDVHVLRVLSCCWKTSHHMCIIEMLRDVDEIKSRLNTETSAKPNRSFPGIIHSTNVIIEAQTSLTLELSDKHRVTIYMFGFLMTKSEEVTLMEMKKFVISCDDHDILTCEDILMGTLSQYHLRQNRLKVECLTTPVNRAWNAKFELFSFLFPYKYNFAECFDEFVNLFKWWKLIHGIKRKSFTLESRLPPDLQIKAKVFQIQICDDPFEVKLGDNYELMKDECFEHMKRKSVMEQKINDLRRTHKMIPVNKVEELFDSLDKKSSDIYIRRSKQLYEITPMRNKLFTWLMEDVEILAFADIAFHGKENAVKHLREIDHQTPYPDEGLDFLTLWCRFVNFSLSLWKVTLRDYPQSMLEVKDMILYGRLLGAEQDGNWRAKRMCTVEVSEPWGNAEVERNMPALKFYHDFSCDCKSWEMAYGACWEPAVAQYNVSLDLINSPSKDLSRPLPIWDKIRLLLHGRLFLSVEQMTWLYHSSHDPYNNTEFMDWSWSNAIFDWTNAKFFWKGDLEISFKTASKYDDCKLLQLPNLSLVVYLEWLCHGDPNDHHSVMPCAPDKIPDYSLQEHDSFRAFRSKNLNLNISLDTKPKRENTLNVPSCLFYASTLKLMERVTMFIASVTRPIRRGPYFKVTKPRKPQLTRHYKSVKMAVNLHRFNICYWMSFSKQHGAELLAEQFGLRVCNDLALIPIEDGLIHRPQANWGVRYLSCKLSSAKSWMCSAKTDTENLNTSSRNPVEKTYFLSVNSVSYTRGNEDEPELEEEKEKKPHDKNAATHQLKVNDLRGAWTKHNRKVLLGVLESYTKANSLKRNLSADAMKRLKLEGQTGKNRSMSMNAGGSPTSTSASPMFKFQGQEENSLLMKLVAESDSKSVVFTDEKPTTTNVDQLHGVAACQKDDVYKRNWDIEILNSQMVLKGIESGGYVIVSAAKAQILSHDHHPVWQSNILRSKTSWVTSVECMQYYSTVDLNHEFDDDTLPWLSAENVEDRPEPELSGVPEMVSSGSSVGGVVDSHVFGQNRKSSSHSVQLQRIISRCKCQIFYVNYGEVDHDSLPEIPLPPTEEDLMTLKEEGVESFTLLHHDLNICTNSLQYSIILDIVNNMLLHVEKKRKESTEKLQNMRFQLQLSKEEDQKTPIQQLQERVRESVQNLRKMERELYLLQKELDENEDDEDLLDEQDRLEVLLNEQKELINVQNEELTMRISCLKESQLQIKSQLRPKKAQHTQVDRRNEVCFKFANWKLTEMDGQVGIAELVLRNFVYTKTTRDNDTWSHQLELGWVKMTNLNRTCMYKDVLVPRETNGSDKDTRQMALRITCSERPPVGGISVKEHFEVNVAPLQIQLTYKFYRSVLSFFFPDKNIERKDADGDQADGSVQSKKKSRKKSDKDKKDRDSIKKSGSVSSFNSLGDIDKMKERAANNNTFLYVKVPEVSLRVSYKGEKDKNIKDIHDFCIILPTLEYHNQIWTWYDMLMQMVSDSKRVILSQAIKQKLHMRSRVGEESPTDVQQEEDKIKMLMGARVLAGHEKPTKKSLFGKVQK